MPAIAADSLVACPGGQRRARDLAPGDRVITQGGRGRVLWTGIRQLHGQALRDGPSLAPVSVRLGGFGQTNDLRVSPNARVSVAPGQMKRACELLGTDRAEALPTIACAYVMLLFSETEAIRANGVWVECNRPDDPPSAELAATRAEMFRLFPSLIRRSPRTRVLRPLLV